VGTLFMDYMIGMSYRRFQISLLFIGMLFNMAFCIDVRITEPVKGIAMAYPQYMEDLTRLDDSAWFYDWWTCPENAVNCVPMSWSGDIVPGLDTNYSDYLLFLNEPDRPDQSNKTPAEGLALYKLRKADYPNAKFVVGNTFYPNWLLQFKALCESDADCIMPDIWGVHFYIADRGYFQYMSGLYSQYLTQLPGEIWITEFAAINGDVILDNMILQWIKSNSQITRYAYFTNRYPLNDPNVPLGWTTQLFDWDTGEPTIIGDWYMHGLHQIFMPMVTQ
jgi:hypothetical protein